MVTSEYRTVPADTPLSEICSLVGHNSVPLGVTDDDGRLVGVVPRATLLNAFATPHKKDQDAKDGVKGDGVKENGNA
jgi:glycine betaine/proline transport system ATP-binding protein